MYNESDNLAVGYALGRDANDNNNNGWGQDGWWFIIILFAMFGGWGNGFGGFGGNNGALTRNDLCQEFSFNDLQNGVRGISNGICDSTFALNNTMTNGFAGVQSALCQGFNGINTSILTTANATQNGIADLGYKLQDCCCGINRAIDGVNYNMATNTCALQNTMNNNTRDIIQSQQAGTQRILDYLCNEKISALQSENAALTAQLSQNSQTSNIINTLTNTLAPRSIPAYITCSPYESIYGYGRNGYGYNNNGCGCGCGCN